MEPSAWLRLERRRLPAASHDVICGAERALRLCCFHIKLCHHAFASFFVRDGLINRVIGKQWITWEIHLRDQPRKKRPSKNGKVNVRRSPSEIGRAYV